MTGFWVSGILLIFYLLHVIEKFHVIPWVMIEMGYCGTWAFFYFTCALGMYLYKLWFLFKSNLSAAFFLFFDNQRYVKRQNILL